MADIPLHITDLAKELQVTTIPKWLKKVEDQTLRGSYFFNRLLQGGRVLKGESGPELIWPLKVRNPEVRPLQNHMNLEYAPTEKHIQMRLPWRGYEATESMSMLDQEINKGPQAIVKLINSKANDLRNAMQQNLQGECYKSGSTANRTDRFHGLETGLAEGTVTSADRIAAPNGSYAQQSTVLQANGGFWSNDMGTPNNVSISTDWPDGSGDTDYDCNSPILINTSSTNWGTGSTDHRVNLFRAISQAQIWLKLLGSQNAPKGLCVIDGWSFQGLRENQEAKMRLQQPARSSTDIGLVGSDGAVYLDGLEIQPDFWCPHSTGYIFSMDRVSLHSLFSEGVFRSKGPVELATMAFSTIWALFVYGNIRFRGMKGFAKLYPYA